MTYRAPVSRRPLPGMGALGDRPGPWMAEITKEDIKAMTSPADAQRAGSHGGGGRALQRRQPVTHAPWESPTVQNFGARLFDSEARTASDAPSAMVLEGPRGALLQAVGEAVDHKVAGHVVAEIHKERSTSSGAPPTPSRGPRSKNLENSTTLVRAGNGVQAPLQSERVAFGAVYEHRDWTGKPRLIGSTAVVPERQFQLDYQENPAVRDLCKQGTPGSSAKLVWVGVGSGVVGEDEMGRIRKAVVDARADRLNLEKLGSEKPYSRHF